MVSLFLGFLTQPKSLTKAGPLPKSGPAASGPKTTPFFHHRPKAPLHKAFSYTSKNRPDSSDVAHFKSDSVSQYQILPDGDLSLAQTLPKCSAEMTDECTGRSPMAVALVDEANEGTKRFLYVANAGSDDISQYEVGDDGALESLQPSTVPTGDGPVAMAVDPAGDFLYVSNLRANSVSMYRIDQDGQLRLETTAPAGLAPRGLAVFPPAQKNSGTPGQLPRIETVETN